MPDVADRPVLNIAQIVQRTSAEGPGLRTAIWVQGCSIKCVGCFNPHMWTTVGGTATSVDELVATVVDSGTEGLTFLGGEPFEQAAELALVARAVRQLGLSVMTFTGRTYEELTELAEAGDTGIAALLAETDLLVDGPFEVALPDHSRPWVGSTNQSLRALSARYAEVAAHPESYSDQLEITVNADGTTAVNGWASLDSLEILLDGLGPTPPALRVIAR